MSNVVRTDIDALNAVLTVTLAKEDYIEKVQKDIKRYAQKVPMKGFRPGKTPQGIVKKMYGDAFLMEAVNDKIQSTLSEYLTEEKPDIFGQPIMSKEQAKFNFNIKNPEDLTFKFDVGMLPTFELNGLEDVDYQRFTVEVDEKLVDAEIENARKRDGGETEIETNIEDGDMLFLAIKEHGGTLEKDLTLSMNWLTEDMADMFKTQHKGSKLTINIFQLEKETTPQYVRKYFLGLEDDDARVVNENFDATITKVTRIKSADLTEEFFQKNFGVATEAEAREIINRNLGGNYASQADALLLRDMQDGLMAANDLPLPDAFLKRWLQTQNDKNTAETVEKGYDSFAQNLRWTLIRSKIAKAAGVEVTDGDMVEHYSNKIRGYLGGMAIGQDFIDNLVERVMNDEKQYSELYEDVLTDKTFEAMKSRAHIVEKPISVAEFDSIIAAARFEAAKSQGEIEEIEAEELEA